MSPPTAGSAATRSIRTEPSTSSRWNCRRRRCGRCGSSCCCSTRARPETPRSCSQTRTSAPRAVIRRCCENMHRTKQMGLQARDLLRSGDLFAYAELMHEHWLNKRKRSPGMATEADRRAVHARPSQRRDRRQARRRGRWWLPARLRPPSRGYAAGDGGGGRHRAAVRLRVRRRQLSRVRLTRCPSRCRRSACSPADSGPGLDRRFGIHPSRCWKWRASRS